MFNVCDFRKVDLIPALSFLTSLHTKDYFYTSYFPYNQQQFISNLAPIENER